MGILQYVLVAMVVLGLDFGTTFSTVSVLKDGEIFLLKQQNSPYIPTYLYMYEDSHQVSYGYDAEALYSRDSSKGSFFRDLKRWVGCNEKNFSSYMSQLKPTYSVEVVPFGNSDLKTVKLHSFNRSGRYAFSLPDLIASFVRCIAADAERCFKVTCTGVICSVPANYNSCQRSFMLECVSLSGYSCLHIINEPSAAAFSTAARLSPSDNFVLVYDFGGGTFDVSGVSVRNGTFGVRSSGGDMNLGGRDVDRAFIERIYDKAGVKPVDYSIDVASLKEKISLTGNSIIYQVRNGAGFIKVELSAGDLAEVALPFIQRTIEIMTQVHSKYVASVTGVFPQAILSGDLDCVLVTVGGSSYLPGLKGILSAIPYVRKVVEIADPRSSVAAGCAMYSLCLSKDSSMLLIDCASHHLSIPSFRCESIVLVPAGAPIPFSGRRVISLMNATSTSRYCAILFEGDHVKCPLNEKIYSSEVLLRDLGVSNTVAASCSVTIELAVSSVGTITFKVSGESGKTVVIGKDRVFDFSACDRPARQIVDLSGHILDRVILSLALTRTPKTRACLPLAEISRLYNENRDEAIGALRSSYPSYSDAEGDLCRSLMGVFIPKILRGARVERLPL
ncbi:ORF4 [Carrot closterovirus 1]|uniref:ORF4 n=1 Tax=Carrot closterovirus 1 TaxID=2843916 RepID=A0A0A0P4U1_9CLOS|nr:ORF4 [Carrot closterovirus]AHA85412.1 ORF4 [Carrot closterovirus 1]